MTYYYIVQFGVGQEQTRPLVPGLQNNTLKFQGKCPKMPIIFKRKKRRNTASENSSDFTMSPLIKAAICKLPFLLFFSIVKVIFEIMYTNGPILC